MDPYLSKCVGNTATTRTFRQRHTGSGARTADTQLLFPHLLKFLLRQPR